MNRSTWAAVSLALAASCGGNVVLDGAAASSSSGGFGGASVSSSSTFSSSVADVASSAVGTVNSSTGTVMPGCGSLHVSANPECEACGQATCCAEMAACDVGTPCAALVDCAVNCMKQVPACISTCMQKIPAGSPAFNALSNCLGKCPSNVCGQPNAFVCDSGLKSSSSNCGTCLTIACCAEAEKCKGSAACQKCFEAFPAQPPSCDPTYAVLAKCEGTLCSNACP